MTKVWRLFSAAMAALVLASAAGAPAFAQRGADEEEQDNRNRVFSPDIGALVTKGQEAETEENLPEALRIYNSALEKRGVSDYEKGVILQLLGAIHYEMENTEQALRSFERALNEGDLLASERANLQFNVGLLYLSTEQFPKAVQILEVYLATSPEIKSSQIYMNLVYAYSEIYETSNDRGDLLKALGHARSGLAFAKTTPKGAERKHYDTLNYLYTELNMPRERAALLQEMVALFPTDKSIWTSIAALYAQGGQESKAFEINKIMYINGMLEKETEIMRVIDYYSYYEVPFRGAEIMKREMNRGRVASNRKNFEKLARLYRQARQFDQAISPLNRAAGLADSGKLFQQLGEAHYAEGNVEEADKALTQAIQ